MTRHVMLWLGSFIAAAVVLLFYFHIPFVPLALGGVVTLVVTVVRYQRSHKR